MNLEDIAGRAVEAALAAGAADAETFVQDSTGLEVRIFEGEVESLTESGQRGLGIRCWSDHRTGFAYGTDLSAGGIAWIASGAVEAAAVADPDEFTAPPDPPDGEADAIEGLFDEDLASWSTERKIELAREVEAAARGADDRIATVETTVYADEEERIALASSRGVSGGWKATSCYAFLQAIAADGSDRQTGLGFGLGRTPTAIDPGAVGREAAERAASMLGAAKPGSRACPVVLDPMVAASFIGFIGSTLCASAVQRGRSPFADRLGEGVGSAALTVHDDGRDPAGFASAPLDGEGAPRRRRPLIAAGRLEAYLHDSYTARRAGEATTANASRSGYRSPPSVSTSNLVVEPGKRSFEELLAEAGDGVYITDVAGLHSGVNPVSGNFSVGATGRLIEGGALGAPADEFTIASDLVAMLGAVVAAGRDPRWVPFGGSVSTPPLLVGEMTVGGT